ncbi:hypothetical protein [Cellulomonas shaoxiangyii]|uniref:Type 4 fimbrial biogenesis protein PilX N-terminal domain-containing protein n=1 Tax=Cellulomonas shaoxiangyii TaxID=2566013 RepID=A0A4P7SM41_9CELL|nr:hypothetical protein [Cellulomonas shaoxiangyii]QCB93643.1 hypothetical protein E5225_08775 [Cellulomonas shaoxiangyii]TGY84630.1 hypothetical protein E5226_10505 [Cellulomonas shaoxiangyii]
MLFRSAPAGAPRLRDDDGAGLVLVIGSMMVLMMMSLAALASVSVSQGLARRTQDTAAAAAAAQSGVEEFISRMNRSDAYGSTIDCTNVAWRGPSAVANPCGWTGTTPVGWVPVVPGETDPEAAHFHYSVDAARKTTEGSILLTVTGRVNGVHRTIETAVGKGGSTDYVYYTDFESGDPANFQAYDPADYADAPGDSSATRAQKAARRDACGLNGYDRALYFWEANSAGRTRDDYNCQEITFTSGDVLDGAVRTNDTILSGRRTGSTVKPSFEKRVTTSDARCRTPGTTNTQWEANCLRPGSVANFNGVSPVYGEPLYLDDTSAEFANHPGCHYRGSTRVVFNAGGTMTVWNKRSVNNNTAPVAIPTPAGVSPTCGTLDQLDGTAGATVPVPDEMVLYVATAAGTMRECREKELGGPTGRELPLGTFTNAAAGTTASGAPLSYSHDTNMTETTKMCARGNLYAEGVVEGRVTLASAESVIVTGDLVLAGGRGDGSPDLLGLVATNSVEVFHPRMVTVTSRRDCTRNTVFGCSSYGPWYWGAPSGESAAAGEWPKRYNDPTTGGRFPTSGVQIAGSIQTLQHSFLVQKYAVGNDQGTLFVYGSIAQRWRGIVGRSVTESGVTRKYGYTKDYRYDNRLQYASPPYFPRWANAQWSLRYSGDVQTPDDVRNG